MALLARLFIDPMLLGASRIRLLDSHTVNQIAAGEVVERPASVVKELIENALDAGATRIEVELSESGRERIRVADDGCGMELEDLRAALQRHATSKIASAEDLEKVRTLGFRGEALPSIASVSRMTLSTGTRDGLRHIARVVGGTLEEPAASAGPPGTEALVEDLFFNTPARLKFLKSDATELGQCLDVVSRFAIGYPQVAFLLTHDGSEMLRTDGTGDRLAAIAGVWGRETARGLAEVEAPSDPAHAGPTVRFRERASRAQPHVDGGGGPGLPELDPRAALPDPGASIGDRPGPSGRERFSNEERSQIPERGPRLRGHSLRGAGRSDAARHDA
jgi:DNA mismatch repair protein MutL